jgi:hypothetical protein
MSINENMNMTMRANSSKEDDDAVRIRMSKVLESERRVISPMTKVAAMLRVGSHADADTDDTQPVVDFLRGGIQGEVEGRQSEVAGNGGDSDLTSDDLRRMVDWRTHSVPSPPSIEAFIFIPLPHSPPANHSLESISIIHHPISSTSSINCLSFGFASAFLVAFVLKGLSRIWRAPPSEPSIPPSLHPIKPNH